MKKYIGLVLLGILTAATLTSYYLLRRGLPQTEGELMLKNLSKPVEVIRDSFGIPHIFAQSEVDAARTLGYVMASERLFQMDLMRRIGSGRLSEIIGKKTLEIDILMRKLQIRKAAVEYYKKNRQNPELENYAAAFYEGVQQYIDNNSLPIEFVILGYKPEPFTIVDAMAVTGYMGLSFAEGMVGDVLFSKLASVLSKEMLNELRVGPTNYFERKGYSKSTAPYQDTELFSSILNTQEFLVDTFTMFHGSNSWVLAGSRTKSGKPILANDPHIAYSNPSVWFEAHIHTPNFELYGHYLPLIPFAGIGHNKEKAWAITMSEIDDFNLYIEKVNPKNKNQVMYKGKWKNLETYQEVIKVKGQDPVTVDVKVSEHGPLIDGTKFESKDHSISVKWTYHDSDNHAVETFYLLNRAKTLEEYKYAVSRASSPGLNISWVDQTGNIAWWTMGKTPEIKLGMATDVLLNGWDGNHEYDSYIGFENRPHSVNPDGGVIISTNFKPISKKYDHIDGYWQPSERYERIDQLLAKKDKWDLEELKTIQIDEYAMDAKAMVSVFLNEMEKFKKKDKYFEKAYYALKNWDYETNKESVASAIFHNFIDQIMLASLVDDIGEDDFKALGRIADYWHFFKSFIQNPKSKFWDIKSTDHQESRTEIIEIAYGELIKYMNKKIGSSFESWQWGELHTVEFKHPLGAVKPLNYLFNLGPYKASASFSVVNNMGYKRGSLSYESHLGPSTRRLIDLSAPENSFGILPTGNSGHVLSDHYDDQVKLYLNGQYRDQLLLKKDILKKDHKVLKVLPFK